MEIAYFLHKVALIVTLSFFQAKKRAVELTTALVLYGSPGRARTADLVINSYMLMPFQALDIHTEINITLCFN